MHCSIMERNELYPIFLKTSRLSILIVGGGNVAEEKLTFLLKSSPDSQVELVAKDFRPEVIDLALRHNVALCRKKYETSDLKGKHIVIAATNSIEINKTIHHEARSLNILVNVADTPELCDFYLGGIVTKGNVKIAISTNGKSPVMAKRLRQYFEEFFPENMNELVGKLHQYRKGLVGDFAHKVNKLNEITGNLLATGK